MKVKSIYKSDFFSLSLIIVLPLILVFEKFHFTFANLKYPLKFDGDELLYASSVLSFSNGTPLYNENFGGFQGQDLNYAFLSVDSGPTLIAGLITFLTGSNPFFGLNVLYVLSFPLTAISGFAASKLLGIRQSIAVGASLILTMLPFHFLFNTSAITISTYFFLPLLLALFIKFLYFDLTKGQVILLRILVVLNGIWYSYYALGFVLLVSTLVIAECIHELSSVKLRRSAPILLLGLVSFFIVSIPAIIARYKATGVDYFGERDPWAAVAGSTTLLHYINPFPSSIEDKLMSLLLGGTGSRSATGLQSLMNGTGFFGEGWAGSIPWGILVITILVGFEISRGNAVNRDSTLIMKRALFAAGTISLLWTLVGGFGNIFAISVSGILRGYARYAIFVLIIFTLLSALYIESKIRINSVKNYLVFVFMLIPFGLSINLAPVQAGKTISSYKDTLRFEKDLDVKSKCTILQLPIMHFPYESPGYPTYRLLRFGLISDRYKWTAGFVGGSPSYSKMITLKNAQKRTLPEVVKLAKAEKFCGLLIDEVAWSSVSNFKPWPEYESGLSQISEFVDLSDKNLNIETMQLGNETYYWIKI